MSFKIPISHWCYSVNLASNQFSYFFQILDDWCVCVCVCEGGGGGKRLSFLIPPSPHIHAYTNIAEGILLIGATSQKSSHKIEKVSHNRQSPFGSRYSPNDRMAWLSRSQARCWFSAHCPAYRLRNLVQSLTYSIGNVQATYGYADIFFCCRLDGKKIAFS